MTRKLGNLDGSSDGIGGTSSIRIKPGTGAFYDAPTDTVDTSASIGRRVTVPDGLMGPPGPQGPAGPAGEGASATYYDSGQEDGSLDQVSFENQTNIFAGHNMVFEKVSTFMPTINIGFDSDNPPPVGTDEDSLVVSAYTHLLTQDGQEGSWYEDHGLHQAMAFRAGEGIELSTGQADPNFHEYGGTYLQIGLADTATYPSFFVPSITTLNAVVGMHAFHQFSIPHPSDQGDGGIMTAPSAAAQINIYLKQSYAGSETLVGRVAIATNGNVSVFSNSNDSGTYPAYSGSQGDWLVFRVATANATAANLTFTLPFLHT